MLPLQARVLKAHLGRPLGRSHSRREPSHFCCSSSKGRHL